MKKNFVRLRWFFTMLLFVTTMIMPSLMLAKSITPTKPNGEGTAEKPYQIGTAAELYWFAGLVNGTLPDGGKENLSANAILTANIIVNTGVLDENKNLVSKSDLTEWEPIGARWSPYTGTFDGQGYTISGLYFNNLHSSYVGLFGCIGANGKISNVGVLDSYFQFSTLGGGVCGVNYGTVRDCRNTGSVRGFGSIGGVCGFNEKGGIIENSFNEGTVSVSGTGDNVQNVGGVSGNNNGTIKSCYNTASVSGQESVGGVCGFNSVGTITNCFNEGTVSGQNIVGGVCGNGCGVTTTNCFNKGTVRGQIHVGGVCGYDYYYDGALTNCYYLSDTATGGINGKDVSGTAEGKSIEQFKSGEVAWLLNGSTSAPVEGSTLAWYQKLGDNADAYPVLKSTGDNTVYKASLFSCDGTTHIGEYANNPDGDKLPHNYQMAETPDEGTSNLYGEECSLCHTVKKDGTKYIKNFCGIKDNIIKLTVESDGSYTAVKPVDINDNAAYDSPVDFTAPTLNYTRSFAHDKWQALYVPFETKVTEELLKDFELAAPNNLHEYELADGSTKISLEAKLMKSGYTIKAQRPYLIRAKEAGEKTIQLTDCPLKAAAEDSYVDCSSVLRHYKFIGTLKGKTSFDASADFVLQQGLFRGTETDTQLKPMRWYLNATDRDTDMGILPGSGNNGVGGGADGGNGSTQASRSINITIVDGDATTGIDDLHVITEQASGSKNGARLGIYDLQGRKLSQEPQNGVYIKDGKKVVK